ncbi:unnamed protein product [Nesidiocoris tenuis]|uniref:Uncharacterized protein n=1 Tax=Nesidiocoris tenuis TaxID=355587 RepID=A0A6H5GW12_9HEMI|nr:unnamed protein product [Nesidiocoris tenuis]
MNFRIQNNSYVKTFLHSLRHSIDGQDSNSENDSCYRYNVDSSGSFSGLTVFLKKENTSPVGQDENDVDIPDGVLVFIFVTLDEGKIRNSGTPDSTCKCWPSCQQIRFEIKIRRNILTFFDGSKRFGMLDVYYSKRGAIKYQKKVSFTVEQLLASIGGTGSLLMGASMISGVEILYYSVRGCIQLLAALVKLYKQRNTPPNVHFLQ